MQTITCDECGYDAWSLELHDGGAIVAVCSSCALPYLVTTRRMQRALI